MGVAGWVCCDRCVGGGCVRIERKRVALPHYLPSPDALRTSTPDQVRGRLSPGGRGAGLAVHSTRRGRNEKPNSRGLSPSPSGVRWHACEPLARVPTNALAETRGPGRGAGVGVRADRIDADFSYQHVCRCALPIPRSACPSQIFRAVLMMLIPSKRVVAEPCDTAETWLGWPLPSKNEPPRRKSRSSQIAEQAFQNSGVRIW